jgi:tripartite-type tricarboxylate transporter receptor subunit TctC
MRWGRLCIGLIATLAAATGGASAEAAFPNQMVRIVVPVSGGSMADVLAREVADKLGKLWTQTVIVENRPGIAGTSAAAKSPADGYTLLLTSNGHVIVNKISGNLSFDAIKDFEGVTEIATLPLLAVVSRDLSVQSMVDFLALVRSKPEAMSYASAGLGTTSNIAGELFATTQGLKMVHVPYRGAPEAYTSVVRGDTQLFLTPPGVGEDMILSGQVRALAVSSPARLPKFPDVPTFAEAGIPGASYTAWFGLLAPAGVPQAVLDKVSRNIGEVMKYPEVVTRFRQQGVTPATTSPSRMTEILRADEARFGKLFDRSR